MFTITREEVPCPGCAERDARIAELEAQLRARSATATQRLDRIAELEKDSRRLDWMMECCESQVMSVGGYIEERADIDAAMLAQQARDDACTDCGAPPDECRCGPVREG